MSVITEFPTIDAYVLPPLESEIPASLPLETKAFEPDNGDAHIGSVDAKSEDGMTTTTGRSHTDSIGVSSISSWQPEGELSSNDEPSKHKRYDSIDSKKSSVWSEDKENVRLPFDLTMQWRCQRHALISCSTRQSENLTTTLCHWEARHFAGSYYLH
jgi:hypothetical protein